MAGENKRKQFHYRHAKFLTNTGQSLQLMLESALTELTPVSRRYQVLNEKEQDKKSNHSESEYDNWKRFINTHRSAMGMEFGNLVLYANSQNRSIITIENEKDELDILQIAPPESPDGKRREFLESIIYYGIKGNHLIIVQSMAMRSRELEAHFNWLLRESRQIDKDNAVFLDSSAPPITHEKLRNERVKSVKVGTPLYDNIELATPIIKSDVKKATFRPKGIGLDILKKLAPGRIHDMTWSEIQESSNLEVSVEVTYKHHTDSESQEILNQLTTALRHANDDDIRIELKSGDTIKGSDLQIKGFKSVKSYNGILDAEDVFQKMYDWLLEKLDNHLIDEFDA